MKSLLIPSRGQAGFGLVELMIAMTLGLVLLGGIGYVFIGSRGAFRTTDNLSRIQENARYALDVMSRDIRMAGYVGCGNIASMTVKTIANLPVSQHMTPDTALIGYDDSGPSGIPRAAGDVLSIMGAFSNGVNLTGNLIPNANIQVNGNPDGFKQGDVLVVANCTNADVFKVTNNPGSSGTVTLNHVIGTSNTANRVGTYGSDAFVMRVDRYTYFIGDTPISAARPVSVRALYRVGLDGAAEELVEHVHDMQFRYGLDTNSDGAVDSYSATPGAWTQVVSVTVNLLMRSPDNNISTATQSVTFNNGTFAAPDRRLYQVFSSTVGVRNRLPVL